MKTEDFTILPRATILRRVVGICSAEPTLRWLRGKDLNLRPLGYEPNELPDCSTPQHHGSAGSTARQTFRDKAVKTPQKLPFGRISQLSSDLPHVLLRNQHLYHIEWWNECQPILPLISAPVPPRCKSRLPAENQNPTTCRQDSTFDASPLLCAQCLYRRDAASSKRGR
jgi:hypothetical protein